MSESGVYAFCECVLTFVCECMCVYEVCVTVCEKGI